MFFSKAELGNSLVTNREGKGLLNPNIIDGIISFPCTSAARLCVIACADVVHDPSINIVFFCSAREFFKYPTDPVTATTRWSSIVKPLFYTCRNVKNRAKASSPI